jgi:hypothetical protein
MNQKNELPVPVLNAPHWRVNFRPNLYNDELIASLGKCYEIIERTKLSLRGWDYPHLSRRDTQRGQGANWVSSWSDFMGHNEYWRLYQSGQFLHLFSVREAAEPEWRKKMESEMRSHLSYMDEVEWDKIPGFISIINFNYQITEIYEFAARLCEAQIYTGKVNISIEIKGIKDFVLAAPWERSWHSYYAATEDFLSLSKDYESDRLVATGRDESVTAIIWFFERFGWLSPSTDVIRHDQENFLKGKF